MTHEDVGPGEELIDFEFDVESDAPRLDTLLYDELARALETKEFEGALDGLTLSRSKVASWIADGYVSVDCKPATKSGARVRAGSVISVQVPPPRTLTLEPDANVLLDIVYEDESIIVLNKRAGQVVHPGAGHWSGTVVHGLLAHLGEELRQVGDALRPGIVHRLDKDTSGLMVVAKTDRAYHGLVRQFVPPRTIRRTYLGFTYWRPKKDRDEGVIDLSIGRHPTARMKMSVVSRGGRSAVTRWRVVRTLRYGYVLQLELETGRTHQIRVHLKAVNAPLIGDREYGSIPGDLPISVRRAVEFFSRQALHATELSFTHPKSGETMEFRAEMPEDMQILLKALE